MKNKIELKGKIHIAKYGSGYRGETVCLLDNRDQIKRPNKVCIFITKLPEETIGYTVIYHEYKRLCECDTKFFFDLIAECFESCSSFN